MFADNLRTYPKPQPSPSLAFAADERLEQLVLNVRRDARPAVGYGQPHSRPGTIRVLPGAVNSDLQNSSPSHRIQGISYHVHNHLAQFARHRRDWGARPEV